MEGKAVHFEVGAVEQALDGSSDGVWFSAVLAAGFDDEAFDVLGAAARASACGEQALFGVCAGPVAESGEECVVGFVVGIEFHPIEADGFVGKAPSRG